MKIFRIFIYILVAGERSWEKEKKKENLVNVKCFEKLCQNSTSVNKKKTEKKMENNSRKRMKMITLCLMENENERKRIFHFLLLLLRLHLKQYNIIFNVAAAATYMLLWRYFCFLFIFFSFFNQQQTHIVVIKYELKVFYCFRKSWKLWDFFSCTAAICVKTTCDSCNT